MAERGNVSYRDRGVEGRRRNAPAVASRKLLESFTSFAVYSVGRGVSTSFGYRTWNERTFETSKLANEFCNPTKEGPRGGRRKRRR
jgi:hypothetical protein